MVDKADFFGSGDGFLRGEHKHVPVGLFICCATCAGSIKPYFCLRVNLKQHKIGGIGALGNKLAVGLLDGCRQAKVFNKTPIDKQILLAACTFGVLCLAHVAENLDRLGLLLNVIEPLLAGAPEHAGNTLCEITRLQVVKQTAVVMETERHTVVRQRYALENLLYMVKLDAVLLQEIASGRNVEKQVLDRNRSAFGAGAGRLRLDIRTLYLYRRAQLAVALARLHLHLSHSRYRGQCLAAEAHRVDGEEVVGLVDLRRRVTLKTKPCIAVRHSASIVDNLYQSATRILHNQLYLSGTRVEGILQKLLHCRRWTVNHLTGRNLVGNTVGQYIYYI